MKMDFLNTIPYVCERWAELVRDDPHALFLTEEDSAGFTRQQVDELSSRVYAWLLQKGVAAEDFVLIQLPRHEGRGEGRGDGSFVLTSKIVLL